MIRDEIRGNQYVNLTYGFQMYKPPSWDLIPAARKALPDAVAALGTYDQTTLLVIGREHAKDSLDAHAADHGKGARRRVRKLPPDFHPPFDRRRFPRRRAALARHRRRPRLVRHP